MADYSNDFTITYVENSECLNQLSALGIYCKLLRTQGIIIVSRFLVLFAAFPITHTHTCHSFYALIFIFPCASLLFFVVAFYLLCSIVIVLFGYRFQYV